MKRRILTIIMSMTLAAAFTACGGAKQGAETPIVADESISDLSAPSIGNSSVISSSADGTDTKQAATPVPAGSTGTESGQSDIITPIPAQEVAGDGSNTETAVSGTATDGTQANGTTADGKASDGTAAGQTSSQKMIVTADINVREEADFEGDILGGYDEGDEITVTGTEGEWYIVEYEGEKGYIYGKYVKAVETSAASSTDSSAASGTSGESENSKYGKLVDGDGDPVDLRYYDGSYDIYDEDGKQVFIEGVND